MADPRFYSTPTASTLGELAEVAEAELAPGAEGAKPIVDIAPLRE